MAHEDVVKLAVDAYNGRVEKFSKGQTRDVLHKELVAINGGSSVLDYKKIRDGKCMGLFSLVEEILSATVVEGLQGDEYFNSLVEFRNLAEGDANEFVTDDSTAFTVADIANGTQGIRRQRLSGQSSYVMPTTMKAVRIYEDLNRVLSGRVDFNTMITNVGDSIRKQLLEEIYLMWSTATGDQLGGGTIIPITGSYDEDMLLDLIGDVQSESGGKTATIVGTARALKNLSPAIQGADSQSDLYNLGYYGKFYGTPTVMLPQRYKNATKEKLYSDKELVVIAGDAKPIKVVYEGDPLMVMKDAIDNKDLTQEYFYGEKWGVGMILASGEGGFGRYDIT